MSRNAVRRSHHADPQAGVVRPLHHHGRAVLRGLVSRCTPAFAVLVALAVLAPSALGQNRLLDGKRNSGYVNIDEWDYYYIDVQDWHAWVGFRLFPKNGNPDIYVRYGALPTLSDYDYRPYLNSGTETVIVRENSNPQVDTGRWYVGVHGRTASNYIVGGQRFQEASNRGGMGSIPYNGGTTFRVWAPNASEVRVAGDFNGWNSVEPRLVSEGNGYWSLDHRNAEPGDEYKYVIWNGTDTLWRVDPYTQQLTNSVGNAVIFDSSYPWSSNGFNMPGWNEVIIYQMHIGTFNDSPGGLPGNFNSAIERLDHVNDLGANVVQLLPIAEFAGDFSWGYNPAQPFAVEAIYGGARELKRFIDEAHARDIGVMIDVVHNHYGPSDLGLWQFDGWSIGPWGGIYFYNDERAVTPWGDTRPDYGRPEVRQYIRDNTMQWIEEFRMDGLRFDSTVNMRTVNNGFGGDLPDGWSLMQWLNDEINRTMPWKLSIAEDMQNNEWLTKPTGAGGAGFDSQWDPMFVHPIREAIINPDDNSRNMFAVRDAVNHYYNGQMTQRVIYTESHDEVANGRARVPEEIWPGNAGSWYSKKRSTLGGVLVLTSPGIPMMFQGQEILEDGWFDDRDPIDWAKKQTYGGIFQLYQDLVRLRRNWYDNTNGLRGNNVNVYHVNNNDKVIAYHRWDQGGPGDDVIVIINMSNRTFYNYNFGLPRAGVWRVRFNSDWNGYSPDYGNFFTPDVTANSGRKDNLNYNGNIDIAPYTAIILSQD